MTQGWRAFRVGDARRYMEMEAPVTTWVKMGEKYFERQNAGLGNRRTIGRSYIRVSR
jgi:hypothetical protein